MCTLPSPMQSLACRSSKRTHTQSNQDRFSPMTAGIFSNAFLCILGCTAFVALSHAQLFKGSQHPDSTPYVRPLKNFGTSASKFTKEEQNVVDSELFTLMVQFIQNES